MTTTTRMLRLNTDRSLASVAQRVGGVATPKPNASKTLLFHIEGMLAGLANGSVAPTRPTPGGWGPSEHLESGPVFDVRMDYGMNDATAAVVEFVLGFMADSDFPSGLLVDTQMSALFMWQGSDMYVFETNCEGQPPIRVEDIKQNHEEFSRELYRQLPEDVIVHSLIAVPDRF